MGGLSVILLENEHLSVYINERLGAEITQIKVNGKELLACYDWESPVAVSKSSTYGKQRHDWLSEYRGGWQFLMPNAGPECEVDGVNIPFHGEWSRTRVDIIAQTESMVRVRAGTRLPVVVEREISLLSNPYRVVITTEVRNTSTEPTSFIWGEHPAFFIKQGDKIDLPNGDVVNSAGAALGVWPFGLGSQRLDIIDDQLPHERMHFITNIEQGWAALRRSDIGIAMAWAVSDFPHVWLWQEIGSQGFPFYGRASMIAIEPGSSFPDIGLAEARKRGQAIELMPGQSRKTTMSLIPFPATNSPVTNVSIDGDITLG